MAAINVETIDRLVSHISTVPAMAGKRADLFVREKIATDFLDNAADIDFTGRVVLLVHGGYCPSTLAFDVPYRDYSWMEFLAREGFDVFAMDMTGYGRSSRPHMNNPCNLDPRQQSLIIPDVVDHVGEPDYPFQLVNSDSETADIHAVVEYICKLRDVDKISLIGWSGGGIRCGTFARRYPGLVDKLIIHASSNYVRDNPDDPPEALPKAGFPMTIQTREVGIEQRWIAMVENRAAIEPGMPELIWKLMLDHDSVGAQWAGGCLRAPTRTYWGWNAKAAAAIKAPVLVIVGEQDPLFAANEELMHDLGSDNKVFVAMEQATHFAVWEHQRHILHATSRQWLANGLIDEKGRGQFRASFSGELDLVQ